jgi:hypothetical protein
MMFHIYKWIYLLTGKEWALEKMQEMVKLIEDS